jgi:hypothetical protein
MMDTLYNNMKHMSSDSMRRPPEFDMLINKFQEIIEENNNFREELEKYQIENEKLRFIF